MKIHTEELDFWDFAMLWEAEANEKKEIHNEPKWKWDSGFKLDFDGHLLSISSRFYPPHKNASNLWEGEVKVIFMGEKILIKEFTSKTLNELKSDVEKFVQHYTSCIKSRIV